MSNFVSHSASEDGPVAVAAPAVVAVVAFEAVEAVEAAEDVEFEALE